MQEAAVVADRNIVNQKNKTATALKTHFTKNIHSYVYFITNIRILTQTMIPV